MQGMLMLSGLDETSTNGKLSIFFSYLWKGLSFFVFPNLHIKAKMEEIIECLEYMWKFHNVLFIILSILYRSLTEKSKQGRDWK